MAKSKRKPSFVHYGEGDKEIRVGEFHYGSAADTKVLEPGKGIKLFLTDPPYNLGFDYGDVNDSMKIEDYIKQKFPKLNYKIDLFFISLDKYS